MASHPGAILIKRPNILLKIGKVMFTNILIATWLLLPADAFAPAIRFTGRPPLIKERARNTEVRSTTVDASNEKLTMEAQELLAMIDLKGKEGEPNFFVAQIARSTRVAIPEEFGDKPGSYSAGQYVAALKKLGFDLVLDTNTAADLTIVEEGEELLARLKQRAELEDTPFGTASIDDQPLPLFTSCCPGWLTYVEKSAPELAAYVSTCKSPHMMYGAFIKKFSDKLLGEPKTNVYFTSVMPCVRKRGESDRPVFTHEGVRDIDNVITTKDVGALFRLKGIEPSKLDPLPFDSPFRMEDGAGTGAGQLFGVTGGVTEAAARTVYELATGKTLPSLDLEAVRGLEGVKEAIIPLYDKESGAGLPIDLRVAVCSGLGNAKQLIKKMKDGEVKYDFVEVMACPGGCIAGGGQPKSDANIINDRMNCIYELDRTSPRRKSHENPNVLRIYEDYVGEHGGETAHELFHVKPVYGGEGSVDSEDDDSKLKP